MPAPPGRLDRAALARVMRHVTLSGDPDGCWTWTGPVTDGGYGIIRTGPNRPVQTAHRVLYEHTYGLIPPGLQGGHRCHDEAVQAGTCDGGPTCPHRRCVRPDHQALQTPSENTLVSNHAERRKTHCPQGHEYTPENTRMQDGRRHCRRCDRRTKTPAATAGADLASRGE